MLRTYPCFDCGELHPVSGRAEAEGHALQPITRCPNATRQLGPDHRSRLWRDKAGWIFRWSGDGFWNIYKPDGTHADDMIEDALNEQYADSRWGPFVMVDKVSVTPKGLK